MGLGADMFSEQNTNGVTIKVSCPICHRPFWWHICNSCYRYGGDTGLGPVLTSC